MIAVFAVSLFFSDPAPVEMPRAEGWLVEDDGVVRFEDRYHTDDLWYSQAVTGVWFDDENRRNFTLAELRSLPPAVRGTATRSEYEQSLTVPDRRDDEHLRRGIAALLQTDVPADFVRPRQHPNRLKDVRYYVATNLPALVCAYLPRKADHWSVAVWDLSDEDDRDGLRKAFEDRFWDELGDRRESGSEPIRPRKPAAVITERDLLKRDAGHSVAAYERWHVSSGDDFVILDDLRDARGFIASLTNDLASARRDFAAALPTSVDTRNTLSVARIFSDRSDYLAAAGEEMRWSAAYWSVSRREIVAALPEDGDRAELRRTFRHEAFHQYLSYASAFIPVSPWLNEGYARYFEYEGKDVFETGLTDERWDELELRLPELLYMDYGAFYRGTDEDRRLRYRLAGSLAYFIEHGMRNIRHDPFKDLKREYFAALFSTKDMHAATDAALIDAERMALFCNEWKRYYKNR